MIITVRGQHPVWSGRKIKAQLEQLGHVGVPSASTVTAILRRHGLITAEASAAATRWH